MFHFCHKNIDFAHKLGTASEPAKDYNKHLHTFNEILFFQRGDVKYTVESQSERLAEGDLILIRPGKYHFAEVRNEQQYQRYVLKFPDSVLPAYLVERLSERDAFFGNASKYSLIFDQLDSYFDNFSAEETYSLFVCELTKLLIMLCREDCVSSAHSDDFIAKITDYIDTHIRQSISLESLSREFNFFKSYISNEFKRAMKIPVMQYVRHKKIIAAHQMILAGEKKSAVCEMFDFNDYSTFYRSYVKFIGHAPGGKETDE